MSAKNLRGLICRKPGAFRKSDLRGWLGGPPSQPLSAEKLAHLAEMRARGVSIEWVSGRELREALLALRAEARQ